MKKIGKALVILGIVVFLFGLFGIAGGLIISFGQLHSNESAGIGAVGGGIEFALLGSIAGFIGTILIVTGVILLLVSKRSEIK